MPLNVGPDGFVNVQDSQEHVLHALLNDYLAVQEKQRSESGRQPAPDTTVFKKALSKPQLIALIDAILDRTGWIQENAAQVPGARDWQRHLYLLLEPLYGLKLPYREADLIRLLQKTSGLAGVIPPYGPVEQVVAHIRSAPLTQELCTELRAFQASLREEMSINQTMAQLLRQRLHMLLWHDEWDALDPKRCWSEEIRRTFRAMSGEQRAKWRALLYHIRGDAGTRPSASWSREAEARLAEVGIEDVHACFPAWFARTREEDLPLSIAGSHVLKGLIWYVTLAKSPALNEAALCLVDARWKPKRNAEKCNTALISFLEGLPPDLARAPMARLEQKLSGQRLRDLQGGGAADGMAKLLGQVMTVGLAPEGRSSPAGGPVVEHRTVGDVLHELLARVKGRPGS